MNDATSPMTPADQFAGISSRRLQAGMVVLATAAAWIGASIVVVVPRLIQPILDLDHKNPSDAAIAIVNTAHGSIPWLLAAAVTGVLFFVHARASQHTFVACAVISTAAMIAVSVAILACIIHIYRLC